MVAVNPGSELWNGSMLLVDKPKTWTSFDVVNKIRYALKVPGKKMKVGHAGTLDPLATGLLIICTGSFTKKIQELTGLGKVYDGVIRLGATTPSYDLETETDKTFDFSEISIDDIEKISRELTGDIIQTPPAHSAIKVGGKRAYKSARAGKDIKMPPRPVTIHHFKIQEIALPDVHFEVSCSKGTYIRSLAYDFGKKLNNGAHLATLRRTAIGPHLLEKAWQLDDLINHIDIVKPTYLKKMEADNQ
ncbi:MAG: tRNA pseudouridine(55) synthase TruB [Bacteroidetes bacterium]|nr:tRNA pseudouridine(55) synthase TruB [Bacteroidota bacterium]